VKLEFQSSQSRAAAHKRSGPSCSWRGFCLDCGVGF
jgi:membrane protease subunit (stomatin/prohibitin family)